MKDLPKISFYDLNNTPTQALMKQHKITTPQLEQAVRRHMYDAPRHEIQQAYQQIYKKDK
jgi:hypothetical protein